MNLKEIPSHIPKMITAFIMIIVLYWYDLNIIIKEALLNDFTNYIISIPFLFIYLLYRQRKIIIAKDSYNFHYEAVGFLSLKDLMGLIICFIGYFLKIYGSYTFLSLEYHIISLPIFLFGIIMILFNIEVTKEFLFPILFLTFLVPIPEGILQNLGTYLSVIASQITYTITIFGGISAQLVSEYGNPTIILISRTGQEISLSIDLACSGIYSLIGFTVFSIFIAYISRVKLTRKILILLIGFPLIYSLNIIRISTIIFIAYYFGPTIALNLFHLFGGWILIFIGTLSLFFLTEKIFNINIFSKSKYTCNDVDIHKNNDICPNCGEITNISNSGTTRTDVIKIISLFIFLLILLSVRFPIFVNIEKGTGIITQNPSIEQLHTLLPDIEGYGLRLEYRDRAFEELSGQDASLMYLYSPESISMEPIWVGVEIGSTRACLHSWEGCLLTWPTFHNAEIQVTKIDLKDIRILENPPLTARFFSFIWNRTGETQAILYWYTSSTFETENGFQEKIVKISIIKHPIESDRVQKAEEEMITLADNIISFWIPTQQWSQTMITLAENSNLILILQGISLLICIGYNIFIYIRKVNQIQTGIKKLIDPIDLALINIIRENKERVLSLSNINRKLYDEIGVQLEEELIHTKLKEAEKLSLIHRKIVNINDQPYRTWSSEKNLLNTQ